MNIEHGLEHGADPLHSAFVTDHRFSLIRGGPFYRTQEVARLIRPNEWNHVRRVTFAIVLGWLVPILITAVFTPAGLVSMLRDYRVHSRMLIAVPILLLGQFFMESRLRMIVKHISEAGLLDATGLARMDDVIARLLRLRDALIPELVILLLVIVHTVSSFKGQVDATPWLAYRVGADLRLTPTGWYAVLVSTTLFQFLLGLGLWKWLLWTLFAFKL